MPSCWKSFLQLPSAPCMGAKAGPQLSAPHVSMGPVAAWLKVEEEEEKEVEEDVEEEEEEEE